MRRRVKSYRHWPGVAIAAMALVLLAGASCGPGYDGGHINFQEREPGPRPTSVERHGQEATLRMAVAPVISPRETLNSRYFDLVDYLGEQLGRPIELVQGKTYAEINDLVRTGDVTLALVCTNPYLQGREDFGMEALAVPEVNGRPEYYSYLIVHADAPYRSLDDLEGRTFAFTDPLSNSGRLAPVYQLARRGKAPESFFERYIFTYAHDNSIRAVADKLVDAAAMDSLVYEYLVRNDPASAARTKVIEAWGPFGINPVVVHPNLDAELKGQLSDALLHMHEDPRGRSILRSLLIDRFVVPDDRIYDSVRDMRAFLDSMGLTDERGAVP